MANSVAIESLRSLARAAWLNPEPLQKVALLSDSVHLPAKIWQTQESRRSHAHFSQHQGSASDAASVPLAPGRPALPALVSPNEVPRRSFAALEGRAALIHSIAHIEFNAINLALDAVWRFDAMPERFYNDWWRVAQEEAYHFILVNTQLERLEGLADGQPRWRYGSFTGHNGLWEMCAKTAHDIVARMALVPRTLEARGLDATPQIQAKLRQVKTPDAQRCVEILDIILRDEIGHVAIGNHWYRHLCAERGLEPLAHFSELLRTFRAPKLQPPLNLEARLQAGFTQEEMELLAWPLCRAL